MDPQEKQTALACLGLAKIDREFVPYLDRINRLSFAVTEQCCVGHMEYKNPHLRQPSEGTGRWGYLQLLVEFEVAEWLTTVADGWTWLWVDGSKFWMEGAAEPAMTGRGSIEIAFAWDVCHWPEPAEGICRALESYEQIVLQKDSNGNADGLDT